MKKITGFCLILLGVSVSAYCAQASKIELTDGSVINGEITSLEGGVYTVNTAFGEIKIEAGQVAKTESTNPAAPNAPAGPVSRENNVVPSQIEEYKEQMMNDPENAAVITGLAAAPEIQELAKDPQIVEAAKAGDIQTLMKNTKFMNVVHSSQLQEAFKKLKQ